MPVIELCNGYFIDIDPLNFSLKQKYQGSTADGKAREGIRVVGYYPDLISTLKRFTGLMRLAELDDKAYSLFGYLEAIDRADKKVMDFLKGLEVKGK